MQAETVQKNEYKLDKFQGPLDLLLFLIKKNEVNIYDIPIAEITDQYLEYLNLETSIDLENLTEFYIIAATLLQIKSRMLLPMEAEQLDNEAEDPRQELVEKLIEYQKYRKLTEIMAELHPDNEWIPERKKKQMMLPFKPEEELWEKVEVWELLKCFSHIMKSITRERIFDLHEEVSTNEKIALINEFLEDRREFLFTELLVREDSVLEVICSFLAILESIKSKRIMVYQNRFFGEIKICAYKKES
jgi:segregation and condensation protein A